MSFVAVAVGTAAIGAGAQLYAANEAENAQYGASQNALANQNRLFNLTRADQAPFVQTGVGANAALRELLGLGGTQTREQIIAGLKTLAPGMQASGLYSADAKGKNPYADYFASGGGVGNASPIYRWNQARLEAEADRIMAEQSKSAGQSAMSSPLLRNFTQQDLANDPVYNSGLQFGLDQGNRAIENRARAQGLYSSGGTLKELVQFGNDYGSTKANEAYNRYRMNQGDVFNKLSGISGTGQVATAQTGAAAQNYGNNASQIELGLGNARGASAIAQGNAWGGAANSIGNWYNQQNTLDRLLGANKNSANYNAGGQFNPFYSGYGGAGDYQYG